MESKKYEYVFDESVENQRLAAQHKALKLGMGKLVLAPLHISRNGLRILDAGTSDGRYSFHIVFLGIHSY